MSMYATARRTTPMLSAMAEDTDLGVGDRTFDVITLFSVFTHLAPHDYKTMLRLLRPYVRPGGRLDPHAVRRRLTDGGYGYIDQVARDLGHREGPGAGCEEPRTRRQAVRRRPPRATPGGRDVLPVEYAHQLIEGTGWTPVD